VAESRSIPQPADRPPSTLPGSGLPGSALPGSSLPGLAAVTGSKPRPEPLDPPMVPFALTGLGVFLVAGLLALLFRDWLADHGHTDWLWICVGGFLVGLPGLATMMRHDAHRRRRRALTHPEFHETEPPVSG
jgi:drug/metabolite transporter (DMT)-like permease